MVIAGGLIVARLKPLENEPLPIEAAGGGA
jgi:hypothetical protein